MYIYTIHKVYTISYVTYINHNNKTSAHKQRGVVARGPGDGRPFPRGLLYISLSLYIAIGLVIAIYSRGLVIAIYLSRISNCYISLED